MLQERWNSIKEELFQFDDEYTRYSFLVELSAYVSPHQEQLMQPQYLYEGCQSKVWLKLGKKNGCLTIEATSDTMLIRGILYVIMELYRDVPLCEIAEHPIPFLEECGFATQLTAARNSGIKGILDEINMFCAKNQTTV